MAVVSNIQKYTINGKEIPVYPTSVTVSDNLISKSWNDCYGVFRDIPVNLKTKINWIFDLVSNKDLETLFYTMIRQEIINTKSRFFEINTFFPGMGFIKGTYYLGTPTSFNSLDWQSNNGSVNYWKGELHWIEVDGIELNNPVSVPYASIKLNNNKIILG